MDSGTWVGTVNAVVIRSVSGKLGVIITLTLHTQPPQGFLDLGTIATSPVFKKM
ncbi:EscU/YscU/HrcU family type III secretion system export apparatus [Sesbania bispinosa]|nr:EscU/YscU/HrcU family type III secretion system export apparatus [Sesbania bispinosa]